MTLPVLLPAPRTRPPLLRLVPPPDEDAAQDPLPLGEPIAILVPSVGVAFEAERAAQAITRALAEVVVGLRPVAQVRPVLVPRVAHLLDHLVRSGCATGLRLVGLRVQSPREGVVEVAARLASPTRGGAMALRLERRTRRWAVVTLEAGLAADSRRPARA